MPVDGVHHAHAVGAPDADARFPADPDDRLLKDPTFRPGLGEAARLDHDALDAPGCAIGHCLRDLICRNENNGHIHRIGNCRHGRVAGQAFDGFVTRVNGIDAACVPGKKILDDEVAAFRCVVCRAYDGDTARIEEKVHGIKSFAGGLAPLRCS